MAMMQGRVKREAGMPLCGQTEHCLNLKNMSPDGREVACEQCMLMHKKPIPDYVCRDLTSTYLHLINLSIATGGRRIDRLHEFGALDDLDLSIIGGNQLLCGRGY